MGRTADEGSIVILNKLAVSLSPIVNDALTFIAFIQQHHLMLALLSGLTMPFFASMKSDERQKAPLWQKLIFAFSMLCFISGTMAPVVIWIFRFSVTLDYNPIAEDILKTAEYLRSALSKVGIKVTLRSQDLSTFVRRIYTDRDFSFTVNGHSNLFDPTVGVQRIYWSKNFRKGVPFSNASDYHNPEVDALLEAAQTENDPQKRVEEFLKFQQIVEKDLPDVNLISPQFITIYNRRIHDHSVTADGIEGNLSGVWVSKKAP